MKEKIIGPHDITRRRLLSAGAKSAAGAGIASLLGAMGCEYHPHVLMETRRPPTLPPLHVPDLAYISGAKSLKEHAEPKSLLYGSAVETGRLQMEPGYAELVTSQCDIVVAQDDMKFNALRPSPGNFFYDTADWLVSFCEKNKMKLRGHVLVWHDALPTWFPSVVNKSNARQILVEHIQQVVGRYAGRMHSWDVVNEVIDIDNSGRVDCLRQTPWLELAGDDYIELAFRTARDSDPQTLLTYNEYGIELETPEHEEKRAMVLLLLRRLKARQAPIDALGIQSHLGPVTRGAYGDGLRRFMATVRDLDMQVFITEMDVNDKSLPADIGQRDDMVAATYTAYLDTVLQERAVTAMLTWGLSDRYSWMNTMPESNRDDKLDSRPLLFDEDYRPKLAFQAVMDSFDRRTLMPAGTEDQLTEPQVDPYAPFNPEQQVPLPQEHVPLPQPQEQMPN